MLDIPGQVNGRVVEPFLTAEIDECRRLSRTWAPALRALGNPDRLLIVLCLAGGSRSLRELEQATRLSASLVTYHLGQLRGAGLVIASVEGRRNRYRLHHVELDQVATLIGTRDGARLAVPV